MKKLVAVSLLVLLLFGVLGVLANGYELEEPFNNNFAYPWTMQIFEDNGSFTGNTCGDSVCSEFLRNGNTKFLRLTLEDGAEEGVYADIEGRELPQSADIDNGPWLPQVGMPVIFEATARLPGRDFWGMDDFVGTAGWGFWNNASGTGGVNPEFDFLGFVWSQDETGFFLGSDGFVARSAINAGFVHSNIFRPNSPVDIQNWFPTKMIWSVDPSGQQTVQYFVNNVLVGTDYLPVAIGELTGLWWIDNSLVTDNFQLLNPSPAFDQYLDLDSIKIYYRQ